MNAVERRQTQILQELWFARNGTKVFRAMQPKKDLFQVSAFIRGNLRSSAFCSSRSLDMTPS
jgi:hypothetical protein